MKKITAEIVRIATVDGPTTRRVRYSGNLRAIIKIKTITDYSFLRSYSSRLHARSICY